MKIEVLNTGTELLLGSVVNTHLAFLGEELFKLGLRIDRQECVPDGPAIRDALTAGFARGIDVVLVTGGLGPTSDDLTRDIAAELLDRPLATDPAIVQDLEEKFAKFGRKTLNEQIVRQAQVPRGAQVLYNHHGTAPGLYLPAQPDAAVPVPHLFLLPGPPRELRPMFTNQIAPILKGLIPAGERHPAMRVHRLVGIGESWVEEQVGATLEAMGLEVGYCARSGEVDLRLIGSLELLAKADEIVVNSLRKHLVTSSGETLEAVLVRLLIERKQTLAVAESCTGGLLAHRLTNCVGASNVFPLGLTTYTDEMKTAVLGIPKETILRHGGAVSEPVAIAMAQGARRVAGTDYALSTTGFAGPNGGTPDNPVGTMFMGLATPDGEAVGRKLFFPTTDRETFKYRATQAAFDWLRQTLIGEG